MKGWMNDIFKIAKHCSGLSSQPATEAGTVVILVLQMRHPSSATVESLSYTIPHYTASHVG